MSEVKKIYDDADKRSKKRISDMNMFGMEEEEIKKMVSEQFSLGGPSMAAVSILSDAQEMLERGMKEDARKAINVSKYIIIEFLRKGDHK